MKKKDATKIAAALNTGTAAKPKQLASPTPEPWEIDRSGKYFRSPCIRHNGIIIAILEDNSLGLAESDKARQKTQDKANARLLVSAPKLLASVKSLLGILREGPVWNAAQAYGGQYAAQEAGAAIAEAEGKS